MRARSTAWQAWRGAKRSAGGGCGINCPFSRRRISGALPSRRMCAGAGRRARRLPGGTPLRRRPSPGRENAEKNGGGAYGGGRLPGRAGRPPTRAGHRLRGGGQRLQLHPAGLPQGPVGPVHDDRPRAVRPTRRDRGAGIRQVLRPRPGRHRPGRPGLPGDGHREDRRVPGHRLRPGRANPRLVQGRTHRLRAGRPPRPRPAPAAPSTGGCRAPTGSACTTCWPTTTSPWPWRSFWTTTLASSAPPPQTRRPCWP